jgi:hypothetical protein
MPLAKDTGVATQSLQNLSRTYIGVAPAVAGQLIGWDGNLASTTIMGPLLDDAVTGQTVSVGMAGLHECISGSAVGIGSVIGVDGSGRGVPVAPGFHVIGRAMSATTAANQKFQMYITREGTN